MTKGVLQGEMDVWTRHDHAIAAILTLAVIGTSKQHSPEEVIKVWADMAQRVHEMNPPGT
jgi:hypothetical protein